MNSKTPLYIFLNLVFSVLCSSNIVAQVNNYQYEIKVSLGGPETKFGTMNNDSCFTSFVGNIEFTYSPTNWLCFGILVGAHVDEPLSFNTMGTAYVFWFSRDNIKLYSGAGFGTIADNTSTRKKGKGTNFGYHLTPIGISYGKRYSIFAEVGYGWAFYPCRFGICISI